MPRQIKDMFYRRRFPSVVDAMPSVAGLLLFLVTGIPLVGISSAVEPDRPSSSINRAAIGGRGGARLTTTQHLIRRDDDDIPSAESPLTSSGQRSTEIDTRHVIWAETAFNIIQRIDCGGGRAHPTSTSTVSFAANSRECQDVQRLRRDQFNVYIAGPSPRGLLKTVLPDGPVETLATASSSGAASAGAGQTTSSSVHDGVVVLDPYPDANFGHLVTVFHVTFRVTEAWCKQRDGIYIDDNDCMTLAVKNRCRNTVEPRNRRRNFDKRCEINFIPLVTIDESSAIGNSSNGGRPSRRNNLRPRAENNENHHHVRHHHDDRQLLTCRTDIPGFMTVCPTYRPLNSTSGLVWCNPLTENSKRCETTREALSRRRSPSSSADQSSSGATSTAGCRLFEICDQAVIVSGGWNRWSHRQHHANNAARFYSMLRDYGFRSGNIKMFFANGAPDIPSYDTNSHMDIFPAAQKLVIRYHIQNLCQSLHCVDSLVIYLNSPTTSDGTMLLWDMDQDGIASDLERYTAAELKSDLAGCHARHVHVVIDQSFSGETARVVRRARGTNVRNIGIYTSGKDSEYSYRDDFTSSWTRLNHTRLCMKDVFREARRTARMSHPQMQLADEAAGNVNLFGAPCSVQPPFSHDELRQHYFGCQNLPTALWLMKLKKVPSSSSASSSLHHASSSSSSSSRNRQRQMADNFDLLDS